MLTAAPTPMSPNNPTANQMQRIEQGCKPQLKKIVRTALFAQRQQFRLQTAFVSSLLASVIILALFVSYRAIRPKPLPGIPYNHAAAAKLFGDVPEMMSYVLLFGELIGGILPEQHIQFLSTDARFKNNRALINHLMAPTFIQNVSAPEVYKSIETLIRVWQAKCEKAPGRPFVAHGDVTYAALDAIFASSFGLPEEESNTFQRLAAVEEWTPSVPENVDEPVDFPDGIVPDIFSAVLTLANSVTDTQLSPAPRLTSWVLRKLPYMRRATAIKDQYIRNQVELCVQLVMEGSDKPRNALHSVLLREKETAEKEGREPDYYKRAIADEFFGFMMAGHDTTATTVAWGIKLLADNPLCQETLRGALHDAFPEALREARAPTYAELAKTSTPYLDAVVEEILRHSNTIAFVVRQALQDTTVLNRRIPKGTDVFLMANGAGYLEANMPVQESDRSPGAR
ncbi:Nn.00g113890.m01.CDS01 [Neocucurbitaria sp. VM-36]